MEHKYNKYYTVVIMIIVKCYYVMSYDIIIIGTFIYYTICTFLCYVELNIIVVKNVKLDLNGF